MTEFIGSRISLISKSDIRYVGVLHEINSDTATVALENVTSYGTESRRSPEETIQPSVGQYDYIVFRGSDVKDLRVEEAPTKEKPVVPDDPAIMNAGVRPPRQPSQFSNQVQGQAQGQGHAQVQAPPQGPTSGSQGSAQNGPPPFGQHPQYPPPFYPPPPASWGRGGPPGPPFSGMYGAPPPGWFPPGQGFPPGPPGNFPPYGYPPGPPGQQFQQAPQPLAKFQPASQPSGNKPAPIGPGSSKQVSPPTSDNDGHVEPQGVAKPAEMAATAVTKAPTPPAATKPSATEVKAALDTAPTDPPKTTPAKSARIQPVFPLQNSAASKAPLEQTTGNASNQQAHASLRDATQAATAAVAAAMAKLPAVGGQTNGTAMDNLTKKVNEMRASEPSRAPRQPSATGGFAAGRGRGGSRGGARNTSQKVEVPVTDFDFESSNAKFSKEDLVKEAIAGSPLGETHVSSPTESEIPVTYNKSASFFDNISSDSKDRVEANGGRPGGREWRGEEQKKNVETFGQGSVDNGYRGGFRGRGRGRGRGGFRGRGGYGGNGQPSQEVGGGRGGFRNQRDAETFG